MYYTLEDDPDNLNSTPIGYGKVVSEVDEETGTINNNGVMLDPKKWIRVTFTKMCPKRETVVDWPHLEHYDMEKYVNLKGMKIGQAGYRPMLWRRDMVEKIE